MAVRWHLSNPLFQLWIPFHTVKTEVGSPDKAASLRGDERKQSRIFADCPSKATG